jgi:GntR family transcriptional regulator
MIDKHVPTPIYVQLAEDLAARIAGGEIRPDQPIPSEISLRERYGVARNTVRQAIGLPRERGLVYTVPHRGGYVTAPSMRPGEYVPRHAADSADDPIRWVGSPGGVGVVDFQPGGGAAP